MSPEAPESPVGSSDEQAVRERANELYWGSDESVNQIASELELSKGALYGLVEPLPSGLPCPRCATEMEYPNRTARDKGYLSCPACDFEEEEEEVRAAAAEGGGGPASSPPGPAGGSVRVGRDALTRVVVGSALLGMAAGIALTLWARRK